MAKARKDKSEMKIVFVANEEEQEVPIPPCIKFCRDDQETADSVAKT